MPNERLRGALSAKGLTTQRCAELIGVDPKTVERWITRDRVPHRAHRTATVDLLGVDETYLWPSVADDPRVTSAGRAEMVEFYPSRSAVPLELWRSLIEQARESVDILVYAGLFLPELHDITRLGERARQGCRIRALLADPNGAGVRRRGGEEGFGIGLAHRVLLSLRYYEPILTIPGVQLRLHDTTLYASIFRADETMLVNTHVYGSTAAHNPVLHLRRVPGGRVVDHYLTSFDRVWNQAKPTTNIDAVIAAFDGR
ncbi:XRE family transcriptional regulator [Micromonospora sp. CA-263727]|uniref:XRE family transcriptional regulator n=1 Tax=Micromonospora sp. CA-263727 TaxID=3239967 RepID=UPI003D8D18E6